MWPYGSQRTPAPPTAARAWWHPEMAFNRMLCGDFTQVKVLKFYIWLLNKVTVKNPDAIMQIFKFRILSCNHLDFGKRQEVVVVQSLECRATKVLLDGLNNSACIMQWRVIMNTCNDQHLKIKCVRNASKKDWSMNTLTSVYVSACIDYMTYLHNLRFVFSEETL